LIVPLKTFFQLSGRMHAVGATGAEAEPNLGSNLSRFRDWAKRLASAISQPQRTEITIQTERLVLIQRRRSTRAWCQQCGREVEMVGLSQAAALAAGGKPVLPDSSQGQGWHVSEDQNGSPLICLESVLKSIGDNSQ
jgi:hypothetical protein